jgi:hypothetical protein
MVHHFTARESAAAPHAGPVVPLHSLVSRVTASILRHSLVFLREMVGAVIVRDFVFGLRLRALQIRLAFVESVALLELPLLLASTLVHVVPPDTHG